MKYRRKKISVIGAGFVGSTCAHWASQQELGDVVLLDINEGVAKGKALDLFQASPIAYFDAKVSGTSDYSETKGSDLVIITAGQPRKPGMSRDDLLLANARIVKSVCKGVESYCKDAIFIIVSNPLDIMALVAKEALNLPRERIIGMAGVLDSARFRSFIAEETGISVKDIQAFVLGSHGDGMVPVVRYCSVGGVPLKNFLTEEKIEEIVEKTRKGGEEIVRHLKTGSAYYAPSASVVQMAEAILKDQHRVLPCAAFLDGEYGVNNMFMGVLCQIGGKGLERIIPLDFNQKEQYYWENSVAGIKSLVKSLKKLKY